MEHYDLVVVGAGAGGLVTAGGAAQLGARTLLIEQHRLGGECLYTGCVPSKALLAAAARGASWTDARAAVTAAIATIEPHDSAERFRGFGVEVLLARAVFTGPDRLEAGGRTIAARRFVIATGSDAAIPPVPGLAELPYLTNDGIFDLAERPEHLLILGGGPIGAELAQAFVRLGGKVTLIERDTLLSRDDPEAVAVVRAQLEADGVTIHDNTAVEAASGEGGVTLALAGGKAVTGSHLLVAAGRAPRTAGFGLDAAGVKFGPAGIAVDRYLRTSNRHIFAIGDCRDGPRLTHAADQDARCVIQNALFPFGKRADYTALPACTYTDPELAQVGLTEPKARERHGASLRVLRHDFDHNDRSVAERDGRGFVKLLLAGRRVVGATIVGAHAGELLPVASLLVAGKLGVADVAATTFAYPTLAEALRSAAEQPGQARLFTPTVRRLTRLLQRLP